MIYQIASISAPLAPANALPIGVDLYKSSIVLGLLGMLTAFLCMSDLECCTFFSELPVMPLTKGGLDSYAKTSGDPHALSTAHNVHA